MTGRSKQANKSEILAKIKTLPALEPLNEQDLKQLLRISKIVRYDPGALIVDEGDYEGWIYYLISGRARIVKKGAELATLQRTGDVFGAVGNIETGEQAVSVYALDETICLKINMSHVDGLPTENRYVFRYLIFRGFAEVLAKRLRITTDRYLKAKEEIERLKKKRR
ncbi:cyclic nucleotide-binding domain-containing protein [Desulfatitalea alkaliphila]|uniref:Cyclic nucleotide-binding domain-containing protein n=1 Tax=Desulfatitalea alkaliphila TaxID=2929485 RepID=A0AA41R1Y8_9BACT|nr:cyclic nucleotide-binding domain-containing protein [Desulfatitalea alkaliphila]MCJ8499340.1 cyclic nucleotide-binding domain-containing protein [Desulfatitalea alkaliphila]